MSENTVLATGKEIYSIHELRSIVSPIAMRHNVQSVYLFGSYARGSATGKSDIDLCVDAPQLKGMFALGALYADLEEALQKKLDLITTSSLKYNTNRQFIENIRKDQVLLYEQ